MKRVLQVVLVWPLAWPALVSAQATAVAASFVDTFNQVILFPTIALLSAVALLVFLYGCFLYVAQAGDSAARAQGVRHITSGIIGLVVMISAYAILSIVTATFGLSDELDCARDPMASGCEGGPIPIETFPDTIGGDDRDTISGNERSVIPGNPVLPTSNQTPPERPMEPR